MEGDSVLWTWTPCQFHAELVNRVNGDLDWLQ